MFIRDFNKLNNYFEEYNNFIDTADELINLQYNRFIYFFNYFKQARKTYIPFAFFFNCKGLMEYNDHVIIMADKFPY